MTALSNEDLFKEHEYLLQEYKTLQEYKPAHQIDADLVDFYKEVGQQDNNLILAIEKHACEFANKEYSNNVTERSLNTVNALEFIAKGIHHIDTAKTPENVSRVVFGIAPVKPKENITKKDLGSDNVNKALSNHINFLTTGNASTLMKDGVSEAHKKNIEKVRTYYTDKQLELVKKDRVRTKTSSSFSLSSFTKSKKEERSSQGNENQSNDNKSSRKR